jgi:hypothetical protein
METGCRDGRGVQKSTQRSRGGGASAKIAGGQFSSVYNPCCNLEFISTPHPPPRGRGGIPASGGCDNMRRGVCRHACTSGLAGIVAADCLGRGGPNFQTTQRKSERVLTLVAVVAGSASAGEAEAASCTGARGASTVLAIEGTWVSIVAMKRCDRRRSL